MPPSHAEGLTSQASTVSARQLQSANASCELSIASLDPSPPPHLTLITLANTPRYHTSVFTGVIMGYLETTTDTQKVQKTCPSCVSPVIEMKLFYYKTKNKCFSSGTVARGLSALLSSPWASVPSFTAAISMLSLCSGRPSADHRSLCFHLIDAHCLQVPGPLWFLPALYRVRRGLETFRVRVLPRPHRALRASVASYQPMYLLPVFISPRFPYSPLMDGQNKWVNNSTSSGF